MEVHGYTENGYIDATIDGILMTVPDDPANRHRQMIAEWEAEGNTIPLLAPSPSPYRLFKSVFIERMTPEEAATFEAHLNAHELAKLRLMYHAVEYFVSDDPLVAVLHWELVQEFGETRADELLAPE